MGEVSEEAEGEAVGFELLDLAVNAEECGRAAGVDVGEDSGEAIVGRDEGGGAADTLAGSEESAVDFVEDGDEGVVLVPVRISEEVFGHGAEDILNLGGDVVGLIALAGDVGEQEDDVAGSEDEVEEVSAHAGLAVLGVDVEAGEYGDAAGKGDAAGGSR